MTVDYYAALKAEIDADPAGLGYAGKGRGDVLALLSASGHGTRQAQYVPPKDLSYWGAATGVRLNVANAIARAGAFSSISTQAQAIALTIQDILLGSFSPGLDTTDPAIVGMTASGPYVPNSKATLTAGGMLDALVGAAVLAANTQPAGGTPTPGSKDDLLLLAIVPASRAEVLWGAGFTVTLDDLFHVM